MPSNSKENEIMPSVEKMAKLEISILSKDDRYAFSHFVEFRANKTKT